MIEAGGDLTVNVSKKDDGGIDLDGGRDVAVIGSQLKAGGDVMLGATGDVAVLSGVEEHGEYSKKTKSGFLGLSGKTRPVRYDDALDNSGKKRAPTEKELNWSLEYVQNKSG